MRPHPQIAPYIRRPTPATAELVVQMAPENGSPVPSLVIPLSARAATRMLADLLDVFRYGCMETALRATSSPAQPCDTPQETAPYRTDETANPL